MEIYSSASLHLKENVSTIDNYGTGDAVQFMVSTDGRTIHGRNRGLGWRTRQLGGHVIDASLQKISGDFTAMSFQNFGKTREFLQDHKAAAHDGSVVNPTIISGGPTNPAATHGDRQAGQTRHGAYGQPAEVGTEQKKPSPNQAKKRLSGSDDTE
jgi:hypothetical protein